MPALFIGHGNPMNTFEDNDYTRAWRKLADDLPRPRAILAISAHWYADATAVTAMARPETIHDFGGFPQALFDYQYPAPGDPELAARVQTMLTPTPVIADHKWGLDHGTWSVLAQMYPEADIPVVQLAINAHATNEAHFELGRRLAPLRDEGVLVLGSGNVVHNLRAVRWGDDSQPYPWATRLEKRVQDLASADDHKALIDYPSMDPEALLAIPTPDHYLPLLYVLGCRRQDDEVSFPVAGVEFGSASMLSVCIGAT